MEETLELSKRLQEEIDAARDTVDRLKLLANVEGIEKLARKIQREIRFLDKVRCTGNAKKEHLQSTNLINLKAVVSRLFRAEEPTSVARPFKHQGTRLEVDIVCNGGSTWIKVVARNARALSLISTGNGEYGQKSILDQAARYLNAARHHPCLYESPTVVFHFARGIEAPLAASLEEMGVRVEGERMNREESTGTALREYREQQEGDSAGLAIDDINTLNLDVSTLLALVTNMTNGRDRFRFEEPLLAGQARMERRRPIKPILENFFRDKDLVVCRTALDNFTSIVEVVGGPEESRRARDLLKNVRIVEDIPAGRIVERLNLGGKIKERSRTVFATGENIRSVTVSANEGFVRAARMQGIECTVFLHEPRSLSELKERREDGSRPRPETVDDDSCE